MDSDDDIDSSSEPVSAILRFVIWCNVGS